jgi:hypothetical protein
LSALGGELGDVDSVYLALHLETADLSWLQMVGGSLLERVDLDRELGLCSGVNSQSWECKERRLNLCSQRAGKEVAAGKNGSRET